jgi:hypothetical protein
MLGAWDVLPWTWLVGYFTNVRDYAMQYSNTVPAVSQNGCIMTKTVTVEAYTRLSTSTPGYTGGDGRRSIVSKDRYVGPGTLYANLPFLSGKRLSVLGSLAVQRFHR